MNRYVCPACGRWLAGQESGCNYCCNCGSTIKFWNKEQKRHFLEEQELFMRIFKVREEYIEQLENELKDHKEILDLVYREEEVES